MYEMKQMGEEHIEGILPIAEKFVTLYGHLEYDKDHITKVLCIMAAQGVSVVAIKDERIVGFILGIITPSLWCPEEVLQETAWWVEEEYRGSAVGLQLLGEFEKHANGRKVVMSILPSTNITEAQMNHLGFVKAETSYVRN